MLTDDQSLVLEELGLLRTVLDPPVSRLPGGQNTAEIDVVLKSAEVRSLATSKVRFLLLQLYVSRYKDFRQDHDYLCSLPNFNCRSLVIRNPGD